MIEYKILDGVFPVEEGDGDRSFAQKFQAGLDRLGTEGWVLQTFLDNENLVIFSREVKEEKPAAPLPETISLKELYRLHELEHKLWGKGKDAASSYEKPLWTELDNLIGRVGRALAGEGWVARAIDEAKKETP